MSAVVNNNKNREPLWPKCYDDLDHSSRIQRSERISVSSLRNIPIMLSIKSILHFHKYFLIHSQHIGFDEMSIHYVGILIGYYNVPYLATNTIKGLC